MKFVILNKQRYVKCEVKVMKFNFKNRVRNFKLSTTDSFVPLFEAITNSIQAIEERGYFNNQFIKIKIERDSYRITDFTSGIFAIEITDNGIGFVEHNYESFITSDSDYKVEIGGKGVGRINWLKAFEMIFVKSVFEENGKKYLRSFQFNIDDEIHNEILEEVSSDVEIATTITLRNLNQEYRPVTEISLKEIANKIIEHFATYFVIGSMPKMEIEDEIDLIDLNEFFEKEKFEKQNDIYSTKNLKLNKISAIFWGVSDASTLIQYLITMTTSIFLLINNPGIISGSDVVAVMMLLSSYIWPVRSLGRIVSDLGKCSVAAGRIKEILDEKSEYENDATGCYEVDGNIVFDNVSFKFDDTDSHLLQHLSFEIKSGQTVAIIGKTGSGKSTIAKILTRLIDYKDGSVKISGNELKDFKKEYIRSQIGLVLQEPFLFARSVYDNIRITNSKASKDEIRKVAKIASIEKDISSFENGYETMVGEKGTTLSGGQKQRLAIARMLLNDKPIIIFDDSLSAVDTETDLMIRKALKENSHATTIIITHRITTARQADKIIVLENGKASKIGTHEELISEDGLYKKLWDIQGDAEKEFFEILNNKGVEV